MSAQDSPTLSGSSGTVFSLAFTSAGGRSILASADADGVVRLWDVHRRKLVGQPLTGHGQIKICSLDSADRLGSPLLATGDVRGVLRFWDAGTCSAIGPVVDTGHGQVSSLRFIRVGGRLLAVTGSFGGAVQAWDPESGELVRSADSRDHASALAYSLDSSQAFRDGVLLVGRSVGPIDNETGRVELRDASTLAVLDTLDYPSGITSVALARVDGRLVAAVGKGDGSIQMLDVETWKPLGTALEAHTKPVKGLAFLTDGSWSTLVSASLDETVRRWDPMVRSVVGDPMLGHENRVWCVDTAVVAGRRIAATGGADNMVRLWDLDTGGPLQSQAAIRPQMAVGAGLLDDSPTSTDRLQRSELASYVASSLDSWVENLRADWAETSPGVLALHVSGAWGSGKSSFVNLVAEQLGPPAVSTPKWLRSKSVLDAWRESHVGPAWWSILGHLEDTVLRGPESWTARWRLRLAYRLYSLFRAFGTGALASLTVVGISLALLSIRYGLTRWIPDSGSALVGAVAAVSAGAVVFPWLVAVGRSVFWQSAAPGRRLARKDENPLDEVAARLGWLRSHAGGRPILAVIDELDRCPAAYVVESLGVVQTIVRSKPRKHRGFRRKLLPVSPMIFVVPADAGWLRSAYQTVYANFVDELADEARPIGYQFLTKLFQMQVRVPNIEPSVLVEYGRAAAATGPAGPQLADEISQFLDRVEPNPRAVVRYVNAVAVETVANSVRHNDASFSDIARWAAIVQRWPLVAERLRAEPGLIDLSDSRRARRAAPANGTGQSAERGDDPIIDLIKSPEFSEVAFGPPSPPLDPSVIARLTSFTPSNRQTS